MELCAEEVGAHESVVVPARRSSVAGAGAVVNAVVYVVGVDIVDVDAVDGNAVATVAAVVAAVDGIVGGFTEGDGSAGFGDDGGGGGISVVTIIVVAAVVVH